MDGNESCVQSTSSSNHRSLRRALVVSAPLICMGAASQSEEAVADIYDDLDGPTNGCVECSATGVVSCEKKFCLGNLLLGKEWKPLDHAPVHHEEI